MGSAPPHDGGPLAFVADLDHPVLDDVDHHHLTRARRLRPGDPLIVADGAGHWRRARLGATVEVDGPVEEEPTPVAPVVIGLTPVKGQRPEWAVQKLTELGVDAIWLLVADRSVVRWEGERAERHRDRLARVAREAAMQSRRCTLPSLRAGLPVTEAVTEAGGALLAHPGGDPPALGAPLLVGPEGGWSDVERRAAPGLVDLGPTVLRAETAAVAAGALLTGLRAGVVGPGPGRGRPPAQH